MNIEIQKGKGIEGLVRSTYSPEEEKGFQAVDNKFVPLLERYRVYLDNGHQPVVPPLMYKSTKDVTGVLTPGEVNVFLQSTVLYEGHKFYKLDTGIFISRLVQNSYNAGYNDFHFDVSAIGGPEHLCSFLIGEEPIRITVEGDVGYGFGGDSKKIVVNITGDGGNYCGYKTEDSTFSIEGNV